MHRSFAADYLRMEVKHLCPEPKRYTWQIFREHKALPVEESRDRFELVGGG